MTVGPVIENSKPPSPISRSRFGGRAMRIGLRAAVGMLIVVLLLVRADAHALIDSLRHADAREVALAFLVLLAGLVVNAFRWQLFLRPLGLALPGRTLVRLTFVGTFFNAFLPTGFGGDAYKSFRLRDRAAGVAPPLATMILDRLAGLAGLALLGLAGCAWRLAVGHSDPDRNGLDPRARNPGGLGAGVAAGAPTVEGRRLYVRRRLQVPCVRRGLRHGGPLNLSRFAGAQRWG